MSLKRWRRYAVALAGASILLQTGSCTLDSATQQTLITLIVQTILQTLLSGGTTALTT